MWKLHFRGRRLRGSAIEPQGIGSFGDLDPDSFDGALARVVLRQFQAETPNLRAYYRVRLRVVIRRPIEYARADDGLFGRISLHGPLGQKS
jgi:hypothetical protein